MLAFELAVIANLLQLITSSEQAEEQIAFSNAVIADMNEVLNLSRRAGGVVLAAVFSSQKYKLEASREECTRAAARLAALANNKYATELDKSEIRAAAKVFDETIKELAKGKRLIDKNDTTMLDCLYIARSARSHFSKNMSLMIGENTSFMRRHRKLRDERYERQLATKQRINELLLFSIFSNAIIALALVYGFSKNVAERLSTIEDNFVRLNKLRPLNRLTKGRDEIARLDRKFHSFARALQEAWQKDKAIFGNLPISLMACSANGEIELCNPMAERTFCCLKEQLVGTSIFSLEQTDVLSSIWREGEVAYNDRCHFRRPDGSVFPGEISLSYFDDRQERKVLLALVDITERKASEEFRQGLVSMVSHDLRTPLTSMSVLMSHLESLIKTGKKEEAMEKVSHVTQEFSRLYRLTCDLLDMAKMQASKIECDEEVVSVKELLESALNATVWLAKEKEIEIVSQAPDKELLVKTDSDRVVQILVNLLSNAIKFSPGGVTIELGVETAGPLATLFVRDHGRGISEQELEVIFKPFEQLRPEDRKQGAGLGLAICRMLAESLNSSIQVSSSAGKGSTFSLSLPMLEAVPIPADE